MTKLYSDSEIEAIWASLGNVPFEENENSELVLDEDWQHFEKGTDRETIWHWFDDLHSKGVYYLLYEYDEQ